VKSEKKPDEVKYLLYLSKAQMEALERLKVRRNKKLKKDKSYLTSVKEIIGEAIDQLINKTKIKRPRKPKQKVELMSQAQTHIDG
jgi:hypothetical protein